MADKSNVSQSEKVTKFPSNRIRMIMRSSPESLNISQESLVIMSKAAELLISHLAREALEHNKNDAVEYKDLADVVSSAEKYEFLQDIIPHKIRAKDYLKLLIEVQNEEKKLRDELV